MIKSAKYMTIGRNPALPDNSRALQQIFQVLIIGKINKSQINGYTQETILKEQILGTAQPLSGQALQIKPEGQRHWKWVLLHTDLSVRLELDDVVYFQELRYRVLHKSNTIQYGYQSFHLAEDFSKTEQEDLTGPFRNTLIFVYDDDGNIVYDDNGNPVLA